VFVNLIILVHHLLRRWCFDHIFRKSFSMTIIIYFFFRKTFSVHFIFWKNYFLRRRKTSFVWKNEQITFSLPKISLFDNQRRKLRLSKKIHTPRGYCKNGQVIFQKSFYHNFGLKLNASFWLRQVLTDFP